MKQDGRNQGKRSKKSNVTTNSSHNKRKPGRPKKTPVDPDGELRKLVMFSFAPDWKSNRIQPESITDHQCYMLYCLAKSAKGNTPNREDVMSDIQDINATIARDIEQKRFSNACSQLLFYDNRAHLSRDEFLRRLLPKSRPNERLRIADATIENAPLFLKLFQQDGGGWPEHHSCELLHQTYPKGEVLSDAIRRKLNDGPITPKLAETIAPFILAWHEFSCSAKTRGSAGNKKKRQNQSNPTKNNTVIPPKDMS